ncbi:hypothetical protein PAXRUDRAFT_728891 [Paxillus rubicundulus Ve08.2h10]|uniref:Uncharacterized protein n=1 Tax=Paxillus rubicundulus Ve08.2h10 TaxID=930991 RepID=A0A0D0DR75_9AGAM|nr:hypothetical protein PAXRUDRAFT_728891 [Paxillus rubicundulus Ve08.2h10]
MTGHRGAHMWRPADIAHVAPAADRRSALAPVMSWTPRRDRGRRRGHRRSRSHAAKPGGAPRAPHDPRLGREKRAGGSECGVQGSRRHWPRRSTLAVFENSGVRADTAGCIAAS